MNNLEYAYLRKQLLQLVGIDLNCYKPEQMQRRLSAYLHRSGYANWPKFFRSLYAQPDELEKFTNYLTINVSSFFRDPHAYKLLRTAILPELVKKRSALRIWSAGCSRGQEAYSVAMLLIDLCGPQHNHRILATDIDRNALAWSKAGGPYTSDDIQHVLPHMKLEYFEARENQFWLKENLRHQVHFQHHNLLSDQLSGQFDLIICRNVVIYFQASAKEQLYRRFYDKLRQGGILFVGSTEIVSNAADLGFEKAGLSFYRRTHK